MSLRQLKKEDSGNTGAVSPPVTKSASVSAAPGKRVKQKHKQSAQAKSAFLSVSRGQAHHLLAKTTTSHRTNAKNGVSGNKGVVSKMPAAARKSAVKVAKKTKVGSPKSRARGKHPTADAHGLNTINKPATASVQVGQRLGVFWDLDGVYYPGIVQAKIGSKAKILYDDDSVTEWIDLATNKLIPWTCDSSVKKLPLDESIMTQGSTDSEEKALNEQHRRKGRKKQKPSIFIQGSFTEPIVAPSPCLATFLRSKLQLKHVSSVPDETTKGPKREDMERVCIPQEL